VVPVAGAGVVPVPAGGVVPVPALVAVPELVDELVLVLLLVVEEATPAEEPEVGTVNGGAPDVSLVLDPPPPQALTPRASTAETAIAERALGLLIADRALDLRMTGVLMPTRRASGAERLHAPAAVRAVVEILLRELVAPIAKPQVLDRPRQLGPGRGQRQEFGDHFERLSGLPVQIDLVRLGLDDDLTARRGRTHAVLLAQPHGAPCYQRVARRRRQTEGRLRRRSR
jgi:hypothetical protein